MEEQEEESPVECSGGEAEQLVFIPWEASGTIPYQINKKTQLLSCSSRGGRGCRELKGKKE